MLFLFIQRKSFVFSTVNTAHKKKSQGIAGNIRLYVFVIEYDIEILKTT